MGCQEMKEKKKTPIKQNGPSIKESNKQIEKQKSISDNNEQQKIKSEQKIADGLSKNNLNNIENHESNTPENKIPINIDIKENPESDIVVNGLMLI